MADQSIVISDLRGGISDEHPAKLGPNQVAYALNMDYWDGWLGGRRNGVTVKTTPTVPATILHRHQPSSDPADDRLWALFANGQVAFYDAAFTLTVPTVSPSFLFLEYDGSFASLHGKLFIAGKSGLSRMHVYDGSVVRRTGMAAPVAAPSVADTGSGAYTVTRYFRVRFTEMSGSAVLRRSEPSNTTTFTPSGSGSAARVSRPSLISEGETHWEVEESINGGDWYRLAQLTTATLTYDDSLASTAVATTGTLSADIGDYLNLPAARWLTVDDDRLVYAGNFEDASLDARVGWTPLSNAEGAGNDERAPLDAGSYVDIDGRNGGALTGLTAFDRKILVFKASSIHSLIRSGSRERAYTLGPVISRTVGAMEYSIAEGLDAQGNACIYFADSKQGLMRLGAQGLENLSTHLLKEWGLLDRTSAIVKSVDGTYHEEKGQYWLNVTVGANGWPNFRWVYDRYTGGITFHTIAPSSTAYFAMTYWNGKPHVSDNTRILKCDDPAATGDASQGFRAYMLTRAYQPGGMLFKSGVTMAAIETSTHSGVSLSLRLVRNYGVESKSVTLSLAPTAEELSAGVTNIIRPIDNASISEAIAVQFEIGDASAVSVEPWQLHQMVFRIRGESRTA